MMRRWILPALVLISALLVARGVSTLAAWATPRGVIAAFYRGPNFENFVGMSMREQFNAAVPRRLAPKLSHGPFSAIYTGWLAVPKSAEYSFAALSHDGIRLFIDDEIVVDSWAHRDGDSRSKAVMKLERGKRRLRVEFHGSLPDACFRVEWCGGPVPPRTVMSARYITKRYGEQRWGRPNHVHER